MATARIRFSNVGRDKKNWEADIPILPDGFLDESAMIRSIKKHKALGSRGIDFETDGKITVGLFRYVGDWSVIEEAAK